MKKIVTRKFIINALIKESEQLETGRFFNSWSDKASEKCKVCAVGAVLRSLSFTEKHKTSGSAHDAACDIVNDSRVSSVELIETLLQFNKNYLAALSCIFEDDGFYSLVLGTWEPSIEERQEFCINVVEQFFPPKFSLEV